MFLQLLLQQCEFSVILDKLERSRLGSIKVIVLALDIKPGSKRKVDIVVNTVIDDKTNIETERSINRDKHILLRSRVTGDLQLIKIIDFKAVFIDPKIITKMNGSFVKIWQILDPFLLCISTRDS